ncbi:MAG: hypothetical protein QM765_30650 [Myxococcales bacterium]
MRSAELSRLSGEVDAARAAVARTAEALEADRPRAEAQRDRRLMQIRERLDAYRALLEGRGSPLFVAAPFDGRVGFREPQPTSAVSDGGPLLVLYRPGQINASVQLEPGETGGDLTAEVRLPTSIGRGDPTEAEGPLAGTVVQRRLLPGGAEELLVACDPPPRVVRQLAMGGTLPVVVTLRRGVTSTWPFRAGMVLVGLALAVALGGAFPRPPRAPAQPAAPEPSDGVRPDVAAQGDAIRPAEPVDETWPEAAAQPEVVLRALRAPASEQEDPWGRPRSLCVGGWRPPQRARSEVAQSDLSAAHGYLGHLLGLGATLRVQVDLGAPSREHMHEVREALARGGSQAAALIAVGFGPIAENSSIESAAFRLLTSLPPNALAEAARDCADFLHVLHAIAPRRLLETLDRLRARLIASALEAAERAGTSSEVAATLVSPLVEA